MLFSEPKIPQFKREAGVVTPARRFSALQRAENSSIRSAARTRAVRGAVSVLFSEPKIPQCARSGRRAPTHRVSVLFSEPKIPQYGWRSRFAARCRCFSALQRAENSSIEEYHQDVAALEDVSVLFSEPKIPQFSSPRSCSITQSKVSVLFSEPKIPQLLLATISTAS